jgi:hypothetical protein
MSALAGALGSVLGYVGSEVVEDAIFERLLWPQRLYNALTISDVLKLTFLMPMGGPLHAGALKALDSFRDNGLNAGRCRGNMLGTVFFPDIGVTNCRRTRSRRCDEREPSRNGFWVEVLRNVNDVGEMPRSADGHVELQKAERLPYRAMQLVRHLTLSPVPSGKRDTKSVAYVQEYSVTWRAFVGAFCSELTAIAVAVTAGAVRPVRCWWLIPYLCVPLVLKILAIFVSVRRQPLAAKSELERDESLYATEIFEIDDLRHGFSVIEGPAPVIQQFFRHYGHPIRNSHSIGLADRTREVLCITLIYVFVLYFPAGLIALLWMDTNVQYLWLGYQVYTVLAMHIVRLLGWVGCGRTEHHVARLLMDEKEVRLRGPGGCMVAATLETIAVRSVREGKEMVGMIIKAQRERQQSTEHQGDRENVTRASGDHLGPTKAPS